MKKSIFIPLILIPAAAGIWKWTSVKSSAAQPHALEQKKEHRMKVANSELALNERLKAAREISTDLTNEELKQLLAFLASPINPRTGAEDFMAINEVMNKLRISGMACGEYANALCGLIRDKQTHPIVRDYAIQHAGSWIRDAASGTFSAQISEENRKNLLNCMVAFLHEPESVRETSFGSTLNTLHNLEKSYPSEILEIFTQLQPRVMGIADGKESTTIANRVTAIQCLPRLPDRNQALNIIHSQMEDTNGASPYTLVAIGALGEMGNSSDLITLKKIQASNSRLSYAARAATIKIENSVSAR